MTKNIMMTNIEFEDSLKEAGRLEAIRIAGNIIECIGVGVNPEGVLSGLERWAKDTIPDETCQFCGDKKAVHIRFKPSDDYEMRYDLCTDCKNKHKDSWEELNNN